IDERFIQRTSARRGLYPLMYYNHNVHFESYAASMAGQFARAKRTADKLVSNVAPFLAEMPMAEAFVPQQYFVLLRFAKWDDRLKLPAPPEPLKLTAIIWRFARASAYAATGDVPRARTEQQAFLLGANEVAPETPVG